MGCGFLRWPPNDYSYAIERSFTCKGAPGDWPPAAVWDKIRHAQSGETTMTRQAAMLISCLSLCLLAGAMPRMFVVWSGDQSLRQAAAGARRPGRRLRPLRRPRARPRQRQGDLQQLPLETSSNSPGLASLDFDDFKTPMLWVHRRRHCGGCGRAVGPPGGKFRRGLSINQECLGQRPRQARAGLAPYSAD